MIYKKVRWTLWFVAVFSQHSKKEEKNDQGIDAGTSGDSYRTVRAVGNHCGVRQSLPGAVYRHRGFHYFILVHLAVCGTASLDERTGDHRQAGRNLAMDACVRRPHRVGCSPPVDAGLAPGRVAYQ